MINLNKSLNVLLAISVLFGILFRLYNINHDDLWLDEMATFWVTDPNLSLKEMFLRHKSTELAPQFYYILIYYLHKFFGYDPQIGRYFSALIGILSIFSFGYLVRVIKANGSHKLSIVLISFNVFLISYSMEMRVYMLIFFISSISLISVFQYFNIKKFYWLLIFFITQSLAAFTHPFSIVVFISIVCLVIYQYFAKRFIYKNLNYCLILTGISIFIITIGYYLNLEITDDYIWNSQPGINFYTNFYFSQYFGSRLLGVFHLIILLYLIINFRNYILKKHKKLFLLLILLVLSYSLPLIYGIYKPIITSKYIIFVLIPIISIISVLIYELKNNLIKNILISSLLILTIGNQFTEQNVKQFFVERKYYKPQYDLALEYINNSKVKNYRAYIEFAKTDNLKKHYELIYNNYFSYLSKKKNYNLKALARSDQKFDELNEVWVICSHLVNGENCKKIRNKQTIKEEKNFKNLYLRLIQYN